MPTQRRPSSRSTSRTATAPRSKTAQEQTLEAMRKGVDVIYQATFFDGRWRGHADFLFRVETPSDLGDWSYEVADAKLARRVKAAAILQMCAYSEQLARLQGVAPRHIHVITGDGERHTEKLSDYSAYYRSLKARYEALVLCEPDTSTYPEKVDHCGVCRWIDVCTDAVARRRPPLACRRHAPRPDPQARGRRRVHHHRARRAALRACMSTASATRRSSGSATRPSSRSRAAGSSRRSSRCSSPSARQPTTTRHAVAQARVRRAAHAVARRPLLRHGRRPLRARRRARVPVRRHRARRERRAALPRVLGARPRRRSAPRSRSSSTSRWPSSPPTRTCTSTTTRPTSRPRSSG